MVSLETTACLHGRNEWLPLGRLLSIPSVRSDWESPAATEPPRNGSSPDGCPPIAGKPIAERSAAGKEPWKPLTIAWLGLLFSPVWAGIMAAINTRRLGLKSSVWPPLVIGFGYLFLDFLLARIEAWYWLSLLLYLGAAVMLWVSVLSMQEQAFVALPAIQSRSSHSWLLPCLAGTPGALLVLSAFIVAPLLPLQPREVCERFCAANSAQQAAKYTTLKLVPALKAMFREGDSASETWELLNEVAAPPELGGYLVGYRVLISDTGKPYSIEGAFQLVDYSGDWKIEEVFITTFDGQPLENVVAMSSDYQALLTADPANPGSQPLPTPNQSRSAVSRDPLTGNLGITSPHEDTTRRWQPIGRYAGFRTAGRAAVAVIGAIAAGLVAILKNLSRSLRRFRARSDGRS